MFEYMTAQEAAEKWNVSLRWVQRLCKANQPCLAYTDNCREAY